MQHLVKVSKISIAFFSAAAVLHAAAQQVPNAGTLLREQPRPLAPAPAAAPPLAPAAPAAAEKDNGPKVSVKAFDIQGAVLIPKQELLDLLKPHIGKELSFDQLQALSFVLIAHYVSQGYLAGVALPPQEIKNGVVTFQVTEGKRGSLNIDNTGERINSARVQRLIDQRLASGAPMSIAKLGEAMALLNEQPGIEAKAAMAPGKGDAQVDLNITTTAKPMLTGTVGLNNQGSQSTGQAQVQGAITLSNPTGRFDAASLLLNASEGTAFVRTDYSLAAGDAGLRLGVNASHLHYKVSAASLAALGPKGTASTFGFTASYPLARRADFYLSLTGSHDFKKLVDLTSAGETGNQTVSVSGLGLTGFVLPAPGGFLAGGMTSFGVNLNFGQSKQKNAGALAADGTTREVQGSFVRLGYNLGHVRRLSETWSLDASLRGQLANKNLGNTERFSLGGFTGVRAYPVGEASGDEGWVLNLNARHPITANLALSVFVDAGGIKLNRNTWTNWNSTNPRLNNYYELYGTGIGIDWRVTKNALLTSSLATPIGKNPGRDTNDLNIDGRRNATRLWLNLNAQF